MARKGNKDIFVLFATIVAVVSIAFAINTKIKLEKSEQKFANEMAFRMDLEERVTKLRNEKLGLTNLLKDKEVAIKKQKIRIELLEKDIARKETKLGLLRSDLRATILLKERLEEDLKEELKK